MNERRWWNGSWSRLTRRDIYVRNAADGRWQVELRRGGPEGRVRTREFGSERDAIGWVESTVVEPDEGWREIRKAAARRRPSLRHAGKDKNAGKDNNAGTDKNAGRGESANGELQAS